ncbi:MAG TPA: tetratricopeptide repeat protein, partial [Edaphobacter sp.]|nr:tetratricopeptide repeat protein [Edaphobacter sp.]
SYDAGKGVPQDFAQAVLWYRKAADQGDARAQYTLGLMYGSGQGIQQDDLEAYFWLDLAASGHMETPKQRDSANKARDLTAAKLSQTDISRTQERVQRWLKTHQQGSEAPMPDLHQIAAESLGASQSRTITCNEDNSSCSHNFTDGQLFKTISVGGLGIAVGAPENDGKFESVIIVVHNNTTETVDIIAKDIELDVLEPKPKALHFIKPQKVAQSTNPLPASDIIRNVFLPSPCTMRRLQKDRVPSGERYS